MHTLGCKLNQLESEALAGAFAAAGFKVLSRPEGRHEEAADITAVNTCTVTGKAEQKARRLIRKLLRDCPSSCVLVTGCYAELDRKELERLAVESGALSATGERRLFIIPGSRKKALQALAAFLASACPERRWELPSLIQSWMDTHGDVQDEGGPDWPNPQSSFFRSRAFIKIQDGCDKRCAFCRVRLARGKSVSLKAEEALARLRDLEARGLGEAVLTGVNIGLYRAPAGKTELNMAGLLKFLLEGTDGIALRLSSLEPDEITEDLFEIIRSTRIRSHFHISVQSGSAEVLKRMGRNYGPETVEAAAARLRELRGDPFLACDIITGFPGEGERDFEETFELCRRIGFAWIHAFPYSPRPGTAAASMKPAVSEREAGKRVAALMELARQGRAAYIQRWLGRSVEAVCESGEDSCFFHAVSENYLRLLCGSAFGEERPLPGRAFMCRINTTENSGEADAVGEILGQGPGTSCFPLRRPGPI
ncbi:MAG: tRNA (N(6)-L-threonylcarbamoyladenosine(37)-C(2))-methylthiotransferase MtaB [Treponema sp.]|jgi:threonylcarbamoyladenosine tRNA methylthiotransferase MtaB|nr:tRNA (N(6)-L-threonylcarbamoyladenosine(37)-C(2))-methylthiotransferase MtaB [Treponema sp.]